MEGRKERKKKGRKEGRIKEGRKNEKQEERKGRKDGRKVFNKTIQLTCLSQSNSYKRLVGRQRDWKGGRMAGRMVGKRG